MKRWLNLIFILPSHFVVAQCSIQGKVVDKTTQEPLAGISVFISNTTKGSATNSKGEFSFNNLNAAKYDLVVSSVNYQNIVLSVVATKEVEMVRIELEQKSAILKEVVVEPFDKDGWDNWGDTFLSYLVGSSQQARSCILKNPEVLRFQFSNKLNRLKVFSEEELILDNQDLGYHIIYNLENFVLNFSDNTFTFKGYPLFQELKPKNKKELDRWNKLRSDIYKGSLRHFMRSLYENEITSNGFEVKRVKIVNDEEIKRVKRMTKSFHGNTQTQDDNDSLDYYVKVKNLGSTDSMVAFGHPLSASEILSPSSGPRAKSLLFNGTLQIQYIKKKIPYDYAKTLPPYRRNEFIQSDISLRSNSPVYIFSNGSYFNGLDLLIGGYWSWSEKIATMLPYDFLPAKE